MRRAVVFIVLLQSFCLFAELKVMRETNEAESQIITVENSLMTAKFSSLGGRLVSLVEKRGGRQLVHNAPQDSSSTGAFRDLLPPKDFRKWAQICEHIIRHYNEGWADGHKWDIRYWEIWNEADLDSKTWNTSPRTL